ncbi:MAG: FHA domain-containing protein [Gammaproteobacteria bacterium]|nr:FHA domain-containing protein [Gammaproteobacteria bacterium]
MSQVSLLFKERILSIHPLHQSGDFTVGHAPDCQIHIDSLAVSSHHAKIHYQDRTYIIEPLNSDSEVKINHTKIESSSHLSDGDIISLGKHTLVFSFDERNEAHEVQEPPIFQDASPQGGQTAWLQYLNGLKMGQSIQIKKNVTRINDTMAEHIALISIRSDGFYISYLKGKHSPKVNNIHIGEKSTKLKTNTRILVGSQEMLFFID